MGKDSIIDQKIAAIAVANMRQRIGLPHDSRYERVAAEAARLAREGTSPADAPKADASAIRNGEAIDRDYEEPVEGTLHGWVGRDTTAWQEDAESESQRPDISPELGKRMASFLQKLSGQKGRYDNGDEFELHHLAALASRKSGDFVHAADLTETTSRDLNWPLGFADPKDYQWSCLIQHTLAGIKRGRELEREAQCDRAFPNQRKTIG